MGSAISIAADMAFNSQLNALSEKELEDSANKQYGETPAILESSLRDLRIWLSKSPHLHSIQQDDKCLEMFLRGCKFSLERTKEKLDTFHSIKGSVPEWFDDWDPFNPIFQEVLNSGVYLPLPGYDKKGRYVVLCLVGKINTAKVKLNDVLKAVNMVVTTAIDGDKQTMIQGFVTIQDMDGVGLQHVSLFDFSTMKKLITMVETAWPLKPKAEHHLNMPSLMENMHNMIQSMQKQKMRDRTQVHKTGDLTKLHEDVGLDILPIEYGGTNGTIEDLTKYWKKKVEDNKDNLMKLSKFKTDEAKRPGKPKLHSDLFGIEGSFRKLDID